MTDPLPPSFGPYRVLERIERVGGATIYLARQTSIDRLVTLTVLPLEEAKKAAYKQRFERQVAAASRLGHPNVVCAIDAGTVEGYQYIAAEYAGGQRLADALARREWFPMRRCVAITLDIARALEHLEERRVLHRSVSPRAIVLAESGVAKLRGFSLSRLQESDGSQTWFDVDAYAARYMAPEAARAVERVDARADLYSLGCVAFHLVTGRPPFTGRHTAQIQKQQVEEAAPDPRALRADLPELFAAVIDRCMQKARSKRFAAASELVNALTSLVEENRKAQHAPETKTPKLRWISSIFKTP